MPPLTANLAVVFVVGVCLGSLVNWAIYALAWNARPISPWSHPPSGAAPRTARDRLPVLGWFSLRRESKHFGAGFWLRPMLLELGLGVGLALLYHWEVVRGGLIQAQAPIPVAPPLVALHWQFISHVVLLCLMLATSFIDIDEKLVPDEITVTGTVLGLLLATIAPISMLPDVSERLAAPVVGDALNNLRGVQAVGENGEPLWLEPVSAISPAAWPPEWGRPRELNSLIVGLGCYWLWCFALAPRIWRGRRGPARATWVILRRVAREFGRPPLLWLLIAGSLGIAAIWWFGNEAWAGLLTALVGLVGAGGMIWGVRLVGTFALQREAMGFGDVTFMMMVGTFVGWQAGVIAFFLSPFAALVVGLVQLVLKRDDQLPFVPYLCLGVLATVVLWAKIWNWGEPIFGLGGFVPAVLLIVLLLLGVLLGIWSAMKRFIFGSN
jgi:leader peptidase (prepilin peptidase) / N-methyltransferase